MSDTLPGKEMAIALDEARLPMPSRTKHPLREGIVGARHSTEELKKIIAAADIHPGLREYLLFEIENGDTGGAVVDLHVVDHPGGDVSGSWHVKRLSFGSGAKLPGRPVDSRK